MNNNEKRQQLIIYLTEADNKKVDALHVLLKNELPPYSVSITEEQIKLIEERRQNYLSGKSTPSPWQEVHERIRNKRKRA